ncbi:MAG: hypothetical protein A2007_03100 [Verrucomicrobia bacterium GWC2_42_7]|nr:MAG: hypothetical protein A2007_03100 [Verrucomicrobia bacterium GWC2_42_7]
MNIKNCLIAGNAGSGIAAGPVCKKICIENSTIADNFAAPGYKYSNTVKTKGRGITWQCSEPDAKLSLQNSVISNLAGPNYEILVSGSGLDNVSMEIGYSNIEGGLAAVSAPNDVNIAWGQGNIDGDPCFTERGILHDNNTPASYWDDYWVGGDYHLLPDSPCINAGDPNYIAEACDTDLGGNPRVRNNRIDMGAFEAPGPVDLLIELGEVIEAMPIDKGACVSLHAKINDALKKFKDDNKNNDTAAVNSLQAFIKSVNALCCKRISQEDADYLVITSQQIIKIIER